MSSSISAAASPPAAVPAYRYDRAQRLFHWSMAILIGLAIVIGLYCWTQPPGTSPRRELLDLHKSLGTTAGALILFRIGYRLWRGEPPYRRPLPNAVHLAAKVGHLALYGLMISMPVSGYLDSAAGGYSLPWFGLFSWPRLVGLDKALSHKAAEVHEIGAWLLLAVLAIHVGAVAWHAWVVRDEVPSRMIASLPAPEAASER